MVIPNRRECTVVKAFSAKRVDDPLAKRTFQPNEMLWWDTKETSDPLIFVVDNDPFTADRKLFLDSVELPK
jgi:hypothetical protein